MSSGRTVLRGTSGRTVSRALGSGLVRVGIQLPVSLLLLPYVLGHVAPSHYGVWATMSAVVSLGALADAGLRTELVRRVAECVGSRDPARLQHEVSRALTVVSVLALGLAVVLCAASGVIVSLLFPAGVPGLSAGRLVALLCALVLLTSLLVVVHVCGAVLVGVQRADLENIAWVLGLLAYAVVTAVGVHLGMGVGALLAGTAASTVVGLALVLAGVVRVVPEVRLRWARVRPVELRGLLTLSGFALLSQVSDVVDTQVDKLLLSHFKGAAFAGWYDVGSIVVAGVRAVALLPLVVLLAGLAELLVTRAPEAARLHESVVRLTLGSCGVLLGGAVVLGPAFTRVWLGSAYEPVGLVIRLLAVAMLLNAVAAPGAALALASRYHARAALAAAANIVVNFGLSLILVVHVGLVGALVGSIAGNLVATVLFLVLLRGALPQQWSTGLAVPTVAGGSAILVGWLVVPAWAGNSWAAFAASATVWTLAATVVLVLSGALRRADLRGLRVRAAS